MSDTACEARAIPAQPDDHRDLLSMSAAVAAMLEALRNWADDH
jgi:hypothetical protein